MLLTGELRQYWSRQILVVGVSVVLYILLLWLAWGELQQIPRDALEALFTSLATLLGLTFTAFSILATFIPGLRSDFVQSRTFTTMGTTFVLAMVVELIGLLLSGLSFLAWGAPGTRIASLGAVLFAILSAGFLTQLIGYMSRLFKMARQRR